MKLVLILLISITFAFAQNNDLSEQNTKQAEELENKKSNRIKRKAKGLKRLLNKRTHDFHTEKSTHAPERKAQRKFKVITFIEKIKNAVGPVDVESIETENPNQLLFEVTGKTKHFKIYQAKFAVGEISQDYDWETSGQEIIVTPLEERKFQLDVDISQVEVGEHKLTMNIQYSLGKKQKLRFNRISKSMFEKIQTETAHAVLVEAGANPQNSRVGFEMGDSYSDIGNIISYSVETIKDGEVVATQTLDPLVSGTYFIQSFHMVGTYQVRLTVTDESGDTDSTLSREYEVSFPAPIVEVAVTQNEEYKDIFEFDLTGTKMESGAIDYIVLYFARALEQTGGAYVELDFKFINGQAFSSSEDLKFTHKTTARGDIFVGAFVVSTDGVSNFYDIYGLYVPETPKESIFLNLSHTFVRQENPYQRAFAFVAPVSVDEFKQFNIKVTDENGQIREFTQTAPYADSGFFHVDVDTNGPGTYTAEITLETIDGRISVPFNNKFSFEEVDLGSATLAMSIISPNPSNTKVFRWIVDTQNSNPGNYGYFNYFYCDFVDKSDSANTFRIEKEWTVFDFEVARGEYTGTCFGQTTAGLTSTNELTFELDARNKAPVISRVDTSLSDPIWQWYESNIIFEDPDGFVTEVLVKETLSTGQVFEYSTLNYLSRRGEDFPLGDGRSEYELTAVDNEGERSEPFFHTVEYVNQAPGFDLALVELNSDTNEYQINFAATDDGYISEYVIDVTDPTGEKRTYGGWQSINYTFWMPGTWLIEVTVFDNFRKSASRSTSLEILNKKPQVLALNIYNTEARNFDIVPDVVDQDGYIIFDELKITFPSGNIITSVPGTQSTNWSLNEAGVYQISYRVQDNSGEWSDLFTTEYEVINQAPTIELSYEMIDEATNTYRFDATFSDDFGDVQLFLKTTAPDGTVSEVETAFPTERVFGQVGSWKIEGSIVDASNLVTKEELNIEISNVEVLEAKISYNEKDYRVGENITFSSFSSKTPTNDSIEISWFQNGELVSNQATLFIENLESGDMDIELKIFSSILNLESTDSIRISVEESSVGYYLDIPETISVIPNYINRVDIEFFDYTRGNIKLHLNKIEGINLIGEELIINTKKFEDSEFQLQVIGPNEEILEEVIVSLVELNEKVVFQGQSVMGANKIVIQDDIDLQGLELDYYNDGEISEVSIIKTIDSNQNVGFRLEASGSSSFPYTFVPPSNYFIRPTAEVFSESDEKIKIGTFPIQFADESYVVYRGCSTKNNDLEYVGLNPNEKGHINLRKRIIATGDGYDINIIYKTNIEDNSDISSINQEWITFEKRYVSFFSHLKSEGLSYNGTKFVLLDNSDFNLALGSEGASGFASFFLENMIFINMDSLALRNKLDYFRFLILHEQEHTKQHNSLLCNYFKINEQLRSLLFESQATHVGILDQTYQFYFAIQESPSFLKNSLKNTSEKVSNYVRTNYENQGLKCSQGLCDPYFSAALWSYFGSFEDVVTNVFSNIGEEEGLLLDINQLVSDYVNLDLPSISARVSFDSLFPGNGEISLLNKSLGIDSFSLYEDRTMDLDNSHFYVALGDKESKNLIISSSIADGIRKLEITMNPLQSQSVEGDELRLILYDLVSREIIQRRGISTQELDEMRLELDVPAINGDLGFSIANIGGRTIGVNLRSIFGAIEDCNNDGVLGDIAYQNEYGGYVEDSVFVTEGAVIQNGARICGNSNILTSSIVIEGSSSIISDSNLSVEGEDFIYIENSEIINSNISGVGFKYIVNSKFSENSEITGAFFSNEGEARNTVFNGSNHYSSLSDLYRGISIEGGSIEDSTVSGVVLIRGYVLNSTLSGSSDAKAIYLTNGELDYESFLHVFDSASVINATLTGYGGLAGKVLDGASANLIAYRFDDGSPSGDWRGGVIDSNAGITGNGNTASGDFRIRGGILNGSIGNTQGWSPSEGYFTLSEYR